MDHDGRSHDDLAREADQVRSRMVHAVEQLGERRDDVSDLRMQVRRLARRIAVIAGALVVVTVGATTALVVRGAYTGMSRRRR